MAAFEPSVVRTIIKNSLPNNERKQFDDNWMRAVRSRLNTWTKNRQAQSRLQEQLEWEAHVVQYVTYVHEQTRVHGNTKGDAKPKLLRLGIPIYGPRFLPPSYLHLVKREQIPTIRPVVMYLKPLNIIHPFYYDNLRMCPQCGATDPKEVIWNSWTTTGHRELHGVRYDECALGYQLRCGICERHFGKRGNNEDGQFCFAATSAVFWQKWEFWAIPDGIPIFFQRCGMTRELFDLVIEIRPSLTSGGLADHIKQLHLLEYHKRTLAYLQKYQDREPSVFNPKRLEPVSHPGSEGYDDKPISDDLITDILLEYSKRTRQEESMEYLRSLSGIVLSLDNTFKSAGKASIAERNKAHVKIMKGGILSVINEKNEIISWRFCQTQANAEIEELLQGISNRYVQLAVASPEMVVADNCCHVRSAITNVMPNVHVVLDVYHMIMRYLATVLNGTKNPYRSAVGKDIRDAILKTPAGNGKRATYWDKDEQERRLQAAYEKWSKKGEVWSAAAPKVHADQLGHVRKGCLVRTREDIAADGSRIEGSHKGWNSIMRSYASGLEVFTALAHEFVLRRNVRIASAKVKTSGSGSFIASTYGSHHTRLVNHINTLWNVLTHTERPTSNALQLRAVLPTIASSEMFGIVTSSFAITFGGLIQMKDEKDEPNDDELLHSILTRSGDSGDDETDPSLTSIAQDLNIDPILLSMPQRRGDFIDLSHGSTVESSGTSIALPQSQIRLTQVATARIQVSGDRDAKSPTALSANATNSEVGDIMQKSEVERGCTQDIVGKDVKRTMGDGSRVTIDLTSDSASLEMSGRSEPGKRKMAPGQIPITEEGAGSDFVGPASKRARTSKLPSDNLEGWANLNVLPASINTSAAASPIAQYFGKVKHRNSSNLKEKQVEASAKSHRSAEGMGTTSQCEPNSLAAPLPLSAARESLKTLTRSQRLFSIYTGVDARSLKIESGIEFFLFMEMRLEGQWASFSMNSRKWAAVTAEYNRRLEARSSASQVLIPKNPRALMEKLGEVEAQVIQRISTGNFESRNGSKDFWKKHCGVVSLVKTENIKAEGGKAVRKAQTCSRCRTIKYPGGVGSSDNHKKIHCSDGVKSKLKEATDELPDWPQPSGIFLDGTHFNPVAFLKTIRELYEKFVIEGTATENLGMEYEAFAKLLARRTATAADGCVYFRLFDYLTLTSPVTELISELNGKKHLRVDCLTEADGSTVS